MAFQDWTNPVPGLTGEVSIKVSQVPLASSALTAVQASSAALGNRRIQIGQPLIVSALLAGLAMKGTFFHVACMETAKPMSLDGERNAPLNQFSKRKACQNGLRSRKSIEKDICWHDRAAFEQHYATPRIKNAAQARACSRHRSSPSYRTVRYKKPYLP
jgi:hypothetical protein